MNEKRKTDGPLLARSASDAKPARKLFVELTADEGAALDAIVAARQAETPERRVTIAEIVRGWIRAGGPQSA